ncbi:MAG TPA: hypothetical protein VFF82_01135 [Rhodocyclaceae bacterium]|nr:hypothetical protein [Rhodocyclaceae bacterium]
MALLPLLSALPALAHHGVAGVGAAALEGPGAPVESASSAVLPEDRTLLYAKIDDAQFKTYDRNPSAPESRYSQFWMLGIGHGFTPWFSAYLFVPYNIKQDEPGGLDSKGWADLSFMGQIGFKLEPGQGLKLVPANESLDDMEDWHFTVFGGGSLPTGDANHRLTDDSIDPGKSLGFGKPSYSMGLTATKQLSRDLTANLEVSTIHFQEYTYADGNRMRFGSESRLNSSLAWRIYTNLDSRLRVDGVLEAQYLTIGRDVENGVGAQATGGRMIYLLPGIRLYKDNMSFAIGFKKPAWTHLNESDLQQGAEGKEKYRLIVSGSVLF